MPAAEEPPTLSEIARIVADFRSEMRGLLGTFQRADLAAADRREMELRIKIIEDRAMRVETELEKSESDKATMRRQLTVGILVAAVGFGLSLVLALVR